MSNYKTPGVYIEEKSAFGSSVVAAETAIPVFIGYTEKNVDRNGKSLEIIQGNASKPVKIRNLLEFRQYFGGPNLMRFSVTINDSAENPQIKSITEDPHCQACTLFYNLKLYFDNGGGPCYIVSIGHFNKSASAARLPDSAKQDFEDGIVAADSEDEITLYLLPEAVHLKAREYYGLVAKLLTACERLQDRFSVVDVLDSTAMAQLAKNRGSKIESELQTLSIVGDSKEFRGKVNSDFLNRGAAYYPFLKTSLPYQFAESSAKITVEGSEGAKSLEEYGASANSFACRNDAGEVIIQYVSDGEEVTITAVASDALDEGVVIAIDSATAGVVTLTWSKTATIETFRSAWSEIQDKQNFKIDLNNITVDILSGATPLEFVANVTNSKVYNLVKEQLQNRTLLLPPSAAMVGAYARIDASRGVWNAPANTAVQAIIEPQRRIDDYTQQNLNVDGISGKSINAIRSFAGKGSLIWGARTLAGNDNDWRYINVRRLFISVEENCKKATEFAVFEANTAVTWAKVKAMLHSYFFGLYQNGALVGASPDQAYYVKVGLGETMTPQDVLEGRMKVEIGLCPSRPAEFVILTFTQILQES